MSDTADFNLNLLKTFLSLYRERNMTRAARELGLAVSTVSEHLKLLREAYGDPLFLPSDKGLAPSILAEELFPAVSDALSACARVLPGEMQRGSAVVISMSDDFEIVLGRKLTNAFRSNFPRRRRFSGRRMRFWPNVHCSRAPRTSRSRTAARTQTRSRGNPSGCTGTAVFLMNRIRQNGDKRLPWRNTRRGPTWWCTTAELSVLRRGTCGGSVIVGGWT